MEISLTSNQFLLVALAAAWLVGFSMLRRGWSWKRCLGLFLVAIPFCRFGLNIVLSIDLLFRFTVLLPISEAALWNSILRATFYNVVLPTIGLLLVYERMPWLQVPASRWREGLSRIGEALRTPRESWIRDAINGQALFGAFAIVYVLALVALVTLFYDALVTGDESRVFENATPLIALALSLVAGVGEEYLFRGVLLEFLRKRGPVLASVYLQALFFGLVHAGYGTLAHVLGPVLFGLAMGWIALRLGLIPAILIHAEIDVAFFAIQATDPLLWAIAGALLVASLAALVLTRASAVRRLFRPLPSWSGRPWT